MPQNENNSWDKLDSESSKAYDAFIFYCGMGPKRSLSKLAIELDKDKSLLSRWSAKYNWVERSSAYDMHLNDIKMKEREQKIKEDVKRLDDITSKISGILQEAIQDLKPEDIKASDIPKFLKTLLPLEWKLRKFQLELEEKERQQRRSATDEMSFKIEVVTSDEVRREMAKEKENRAL